MAHKGLTLDTGALIAVEKNNRVVWALIKKAIAREVTVTVPTPVLAQVHRVSQARTALVALILKGCLIESFDQKMAKETGRLLGAANTSDVVDGSVVEGALRRGDAVMTSDPDDIERLDREGVLNIITV